MRYLKLFSILVLTILLLVILVECTAYLYIHHAGSIFTPYSISEEEVSRFSLKDYQEETKLFYSDKVVEPIVGYYDAAEKAQELWNKEFTTFTIAGFHNPNPGSGIEVLFDSEEACWLVKGTIPKNPTPPDTAGWTGAIPHVILRTNGDVVAMWMG